MPSWAGLWRPCPPSSMEHQSTPDLLRSLADDIESFPRFIRRDNGSQSVRDAIAGILQEHYGMANPDALDALDGFTRKLRDTTDAYYRNQFL